MPEPSPGEVAYTAYVAALRPSVVRYLTALYANLGPDEHAAWEAAAQAVRAAAREEERMPEPLSPEGYAATGGTCCPQCGSADLAHGRLGQQGTAVLHPMACLACLARWRNVYELRGYEAEP